MKFKAHTKVQKGLETINLAPLIDVVFQLLIFFMLSSSFTAPSGINVKLPKTVTSDIITEENLTVTVTSENVIYFNNKIVSVKELKSILGTQDNVKRPLLIKADRRSSMGRIVDVWDLCRTLGIERINIATNQDK